MLGGIYTHQGKREYNEDSCTAIKSRNVLCAIIADGLGGHGGGDVASGETVQLMKQRFKDMEKPGMISQEQYNEWFDEANSRVLSMQTPQCSMRTTLAMLSVDDVLNKATWAHLGDSRIYHFIDGKVTFYTFDHSVSRMAVLAREIELEEVRFHKDRSKLLKVIGKENVGNPEYGEVELDRNHSHAFLLCTDGFWEYVTEQQMEETLAISSHPKEWLKNMYHILKDYVEVNEICNDNNSAIAVFV